MFYWQLDRISYGSVSLLVRNSNGTTIPTYNLPAIDWTVFASFIANITGPSGLPLRVIAPGAIDSSQLLRYDFGWSFLIYQPLVRSSISTLISNVNILVGSRGESDILVGPSGSSGDSDILVRPP